MSTKTTFKRISLVAVAALSMGVLTSVAPASAAQTTTSATLTVGTFARATVNTWTATATLTFVGGEGATPTLANNTSAVVNGTGTAGANPTGVVTVGATTVVSATGASGSITTYVATAPVTITSATNANVANVIAAAGNYTIKIVDSVNTTAAVAAQAVATVSPTTGGTFIAGTYGASSTTSAAIQVVNGQATLQFIQGTSDTTYTLTSSGVGRILSATGSTTASAALVSGDVAAGVTWSPATTIQSLAVLTTSAVAGVQTLNFQPVGAGGAPGTAVTATITWGAAATISATNSTSIIDTTTASTFSNPAADLAVAFDGSIGAVRAATIKVLLKDSNLGVAASKTLTAVISGSGLIQGKVGTGTANTYTDGSASGSRVATVDTDALGQGFFAVFADGNGGVGTITISQGTTVISTEVVTFSGIATQLKNSNLDTDGASLNSVYIGVAGTGKLTVSSYDALGNKAVTSPTGLVVTSDTTTVATVAISGGTGDITVTGVAVGKTNITISVGALATATIKLVVPVEITKTTAKTVSMAWDKATYAPGEKMILTVKALDSNGSGVADGARVLFSDTATANVAIGALPTGTVTLAGGIKAYTYYAPFAAGEITVTAKEGAAVDAVKAATVAGAAAYTAATITATASVVNASADAATDAANEATDAANAATDAALAAADAADAATAAAEDASAAVATLAKSVNTALASLKKQITALTALVNKLLKK
jgi:hypothetical protein